MPKYLETGRLLLRIAANDCDPRLLEAELAGFMADLGLEPALLLDRGAGIGVVAALEPIIYSI